MQARGAEESGLSLRDIILGGQDGLVNVLGIVLGISAVTANVHVLLAAGLAATFAESTSMAAVAYTSAQADRARYESEVERIRRQIEEAPAQARAAVAAIYAAKGFNGSLLDQIVATITARPETWLATLAAEERDVRAVDMADVRRSAVIVGIATLIGSLIPLLPFLMLPRIVALVAAIVVSAAVLFAVGAYKAESTIGDWRRSGIQMTVIGLGAALIAFIVARIFHASA